MMSCKSIMANACESTKTLATNAYQSMTIENGKQILFQWKGRYVELFQSNRNFAFANFAVANCIAFKCMNVLVNKINAYRNTTTEKSALYLTKNVALATVVGAGSYAFNVLFSKVTGFTLSQKALVAFSVASAILQYALLPKKAVPSTASGLTSSKTGESLSLSLSTTIFHGEMTGASLSLSLSTTIFHGEMVDSEGELDDLKLIAPSTNSSNSSTALDPELEEAK